VPTRRPPSPPIRLPRANGRILEDERLEIRSAPQPPRDPGADVEDITAGSAVGGSRVVHASVPARVLAFVLDAVLLSALLFVGSLALRALLGPVVAFQQSGSAGARLSVDQGRLIAVAVTNAVLSALYFAGSWIAASATPGQRLLGVRVESARESVRSMLGHAVRRWLLLMGPLSLGALAAIGAPVLGPFLTLALPAWYLVLLATTLRSPARQGLHDRWAGTVVVARRARRHSGS
jgi:uncharacterized RDD family membrane protein YckC